MSVYTRVSDETFAEILNHYSLGDFVSATGIQQGIENSNYFLRTTQGEYVFTLFERISSQEVEFYISLLEQLSHADIACPKPQYNKPQHNKPQNIVNQLDNQPFTLVSRLNGSTVSDIKLEHVTAVAMELARLHNATIAGIETTNPLLQNRRGNSWREKTAMALSNKLPADEADAIKSELEAYHEFDPSHLPSGIIHADLFPDNAIFDDNQLSGIIDFYDACYGAYVYDVAITLNAWCFTPRGEPIEDFISAFLKSYQSVRPFSDEEGDALPMMLRMAAMRFWLSRLEVFHSENRRHSSHEVLTLSKDPDEYRQILEFHRQSSLT